MSAIVAKDVVVQKGKQAILGPISVQVRQGAITGLIGPSGSGKTTFMRTIVGVQMVSAGKVTVLDTVAGSKELRHKIGYVTQSPAVYNDLTVEQNLRYFATLASASRAQVSQVIDSVELTEHRHKLVSQLSGGQRARVSLAVALLGDPEILILDEPTVGLDPILRRELWKQFQALADEGKTLLVSSHVMDEAERCSDLVLIRDGHVLWNDSRQNLLDYTKQANVGDAFVAMIEKNNSERNA